MRTGLINVVHKLAMKILHTLIVTRDMCKLHSITRVMTYRDRTPSHLAENARVLSETCRCSSVPCAH